MAEGWAETPGVHLELQEHLSLNVEEVCPPQYTGRQNSVFEALFEIV